MKKILIFAGTTEGRALSEQLREASIEHGVCIATEYGRELLKEESGVQIYQGRMNSDEMRELIKRDGYEVIVDATHPYAELVTENIKESAEKENCIYIRLLRNTQLQVDGQQGKVTSYESEEACIEALKKEEGTILLTTGSKGLSKYCKVEEIRERLIARVLPGIESVGICEEAGLSGKQIIAMQGPFSVELNRALIDQYHIRHLVTKQSGSVGGFMEKLQAAKERDVQVYVIGKKQQEEGLSYFEVIQKLEDICGITLRKTPSFQITLAGVGMGERCGLTIECEKAIYQADILLGARRLLVTYQEMAEGRRLEAKAIYQPEKILDFLKACSETYSYLPLIKVTVLFSGDSGFYSGCKKLREALSREIGENRLNGSVRVLPGISSVSAMAALLQESYEDTFICSIHGRKEEEWVPELSCEIRYQKKSYVLVSGEKDVVRLRELLQKESFCGKLYAACQLSYPEQKLYAWEIGKTSEDGLIDQDIDEAMEHLPEALYVCMIKNNAPLNRSCTPGICDEEFIRGQVPMTKEEVREVILCKLKLTDQELVYDIGSGTGSIAIEAAARSSGIRVLAIEKNPEAVSLIRQNKEKFHTQNVEVLEGEAPLCMMELPAPDKAFIGGSSGNLLEIVSLLYQKNKKMRIVISAISLETRAELMEIAKHFKLQKEEFTEIQVSKGKKAGAYHLLQAQNPILLYAFEFE